jgi:hypothetical protein
MPAASEARHDPDQIRELELLRREYEAQMLASSDPQERRRWYAVKNQIEVSIPAPDHWRANERETFQLFFWI